MIGGREDRVGECRILAEFAKRVGAGPLVVATVASEVPDELWALYRPLFRRLGVRRVQHLPIETREDAVNGDGVNEHIVERAAGIFFTGGSQLRITTLLGGTALCERVAELHARGGAIGGTSAGASVLSDTMLVSGASDKSPRLGDMLRMAPGLGLLPDMIVDQHFAERGRIGRLIAAVAQNARALGIGLDEDTAIVVDPPGAFRVLGQGAVYVVDGTTVTDTNVVEGEDERTLTVHDVRIHLLSDGQRFDLATRRPLPPVPAPADVEERCHRQARPR